MIEYDHQAQGVFCFAKSERGERVERKEQAWEQEKEYQDFLAKFRPKKTTDECYTPPLVYEAVRSWACEEYGIDPETIVRPFYPGGDYEHYDYPYGCTVLDNPPFSILSKICAYYLDNGIKFFLFAPALTVLAGRSNTMRMCHIVPDAEVEYENGAIVRTGFVTSYESGTILRTAPELHKRIEEAVKKRRKEKCKSVPKYEYPDHIATAAMMQKYSKYGIDFRIKATDCQPIARMDAQRLYGKSIYGGGLLLSEKAAAERAAAERAAAERAAAGRTTAKRWELSEAEWEIIKGLQR